MQDQQFDTALLLRDVALSIKAIANGQLRKKGLNVQQGSMMRYILAHQEEGVIQQDLACQFQRKGASITSMLQGMERKGWICRRFAPDNERQKRVYVLEKGVDMIAYFNETFSVIEQRLTAGMTEQEKRLLQQMLNKLQCNLHDTQQD